MELAILEFKDKDKIFDLIHDQFFDINNVIFLPEKGYVEIKFNTWDYNNEKLKKAVLYVYYVESMEIDDPEKIERYSFNTIKYDKKTGQLRIINEPNMDIKLVVSKFAMKLEADNSLKIPTVDFPWWF